VENCTSKCKKTIRQKSKVAAGAIKAIKWEKENKAAIEEYNERIKKYGAFGDSFRSF
jgi:post-segregation antitoxin (ccd killing protein)